MVFHTALIVDDSKLARVTLKKKLESHGLVVEVVDSAQQAYSTLPAMQPDIIFMDHLMPGIDGFEATQHIRQMPGFQQVPIVMCTGKEQEGYLQEALAIGASYILSKPPVDEALNAILASPALVEPAESELAAEQPLLDIPAEATALESDMADFMADYKEPVVAVPTESLDLAAMPETDIADFMAEEFAAPVVAIPEISAPIPATTIPEEIPAPAPSVAVIQAGLDAEAIQHICAQMIRDAIAEMPVPEVPEIVLPVTTPAAVDIEQILSTVNASVAHQLAVTTTTLKAEMQAGLDALIAEKITQTMDQDIQGILDLRLNVMLAQKFAETNAKIESMEKQLSDKAQSSSASPDMLAMDSSFTLEQPGGLSSRMEQLYEEQIALVSRFKKAQMIAIGALVIAAAALVLSLI